jgi:lipoyl(octanoyl) transferase
LLHDTPEGQRVIRVVRLGTIPYASALVLQRDIARARIERALNDDVLLLVEHPHVITRGRSTKAGNLVASPELLASRGVELFDAERGGDVTYHGPGQLVGYPIVDLKTHRQDLHWYLRQLEEVLILALGRARLRAHRQAGQTGVWVGGPRKIASIGVHAKDWVTWHGFALNVFTDLSYFNFIVPCGIAGVQMTSMEQELGVGGSPTIETVADHVRDGFEAAFKVRTDETTLDQLGFAFGNREMELAST